MPNLTLTSTDLRLIGAAMQIANAVVQGSAGDVGSFERAIRIIEDVGAAWNDTVLKMRDATIRGIVAGGSNAEDVMYV